MELDSSKRAMWFSPTGIVAALGGCVFLMAIAVAVVWFGGPRTVTLEITEPVRKTVVCHLVVDGRAESREDIAPVTYELEANQMRFAVICRDAAVPNTVSVAVHDDVGTGGSLIGAGATGEYRSGSWGTTFQITAMTPTHVASMRSSATSEPETDKQTATGETPSTPKANGTSASAEE